MTYNLYNEERHIIKKTNFKIKKKYTFYIFWI